MNWQGGSITTENVHEAISALLEFFLKGPFTRVEVRFEDEVVSVGTAVCFNEITLTIPRGTTGTLMISDSDADIEIPIATRGSLPQPPLLYTRDFRVELTYFPEDEDSVHLYYLRS